MRVKHGIEPLGSPVDMGRGGLKPKAVAHRASLEVPRSLLDHQKAKQRLTDNTVAFRG
jgi:hypothetical protein